MFSNIPLNTLFTVQSNTGSISTLGVPTQGWNNTGVTFYGHIRQLNEQESKRYSKMEYTSTHMAYTNNTSLSLVEGNRLTIGDNKYYYVVSIDNPHRLNNHLQIALEQRNE